MTLEPTRRPTRDVPKNHESDDQTLETPHEERVPDINKDRLWSAPSGPTSVASTQAAAPTVNTDWWVDYESVGGKSKRLPDRYGDDQLVVDHLKIRPNGATKALQLTGGNMAKSGDVFLGSAAVPKGNGRVTAAVRYGKKSSFQVKLELEPAATSSERAALATANAEAKALVLSMLEDRGDYAAIATEIQAQFADRFPGKTLMVSVNPVRKGGAVTGIFAADHAEYSVDSDAKFAVMIDPTGERTDSKAWTTGATKEESTGESDQAGVKATQDLSTRDKTADKSKFISSFNTTLKSNVQTIFKSIEAQIDATHETNVTSHAEDTTWTIGVGPAKEKKDDGDKDDGGITGILKEKVSSTIGWLYRKGSSLLKRSPIVSAALDLGGSIFGEIMARGSIERKKTESEGGSETKGGSSSTSHGKEISSLQTIATELSTQMINETQHDVEKEIATRLGTEVSSTRKVDEAKKQTLNRTTSGTDVTIESGKPRVFIKKLS